MVDGTRAPRRLGDVLIDGSRIAAVGPPGSLSHADAERIDVSGMVVCPGFVDIHTHYDAQILWDPDLTPSSWHGVTTVIMGNCGFTVAPTRAEHREVVVRTLQNVEDMSIEALEAGINWNFESFSEYLEVLDRMPKRLNVAAMVGHSAIRLFVMGPDAMERAASPPERADIASQVVQALEAGAAGFATSRSAPHTGAFGRPVPSRLADVDELVAIAEAMDTVDRGTIQLAAGAGLDEMAVMAARTERPITWSALLTGRYAPVTSAEMVDRTAALRPSVWPQISCRPLVMQFCLGSPRGILAGVPALAELVTLTASERLGLVESRTWRQRAEEQLAPLWKTLWDGLSIEETSAHGGLVGAPLGPLARAREVAPFDLMVDLALQDGLDTRFRVVLGNNDDDELAALLRDPRTLLGLSDAGAHAGQLCDAGYATHLLGHWSREKGVIDLETAVWRLTGQPAAVFGIADRGRLAPSWAADVVVFDAGEIGCEPSVRVADFPAGAERLVAGSRGIQHVFVNGTAIVRNTKVVEGARPGVLLRS